MRRGDTAIGRHGDTLKVGIFLRISVSPLPPVGPLLLEVVYRVNANL